MYYSLLYFLIFGYINVSICQESCQTPGRRRGTCVPIENCPLLLNYFQLIQLGELPSNQADLLQKSQCSHPNSRTRVCCGTVRNTVIQVGGITPNQPTNIPNVPNQPNTNQQLSGAQLLDQNNCGLLGLSRRIVGGRNTKLGEWPWIVLIRSRDKIGSLKWTCGGTLISKQYVLSAAHCFASLTPISVRIGEHSLSSEPDCDTKRGVCAPPHQDIAIERVIKHNQYSSGCLYCNDIALLRLEKPAVLHREYVVPICLPLDPINQMGISAQDFNGLDGNAAGWGSVSPDEYDRKNTDVLQQVTLLIQEQSYCNNLKKNLQDKQIALCAGSGDNKDTCQGDSGGPLTLTDISFRQTYLVGITSRGPRFCGEQNTQGLYTNVTHFIPWILSNLKT